MERDDATLIAGCIRGDATAWNALVERYGRLVYSIPRKYGFSDTDADDIFQTVMGIVLRRLDTLRDQSRLSAWLIRTTYRECWRIRRQAKKAGALDADLPDGGEPTEDRLLELERQQLVRQALEQVDERCRKLLVALYFEDPPRSYEQISEEFGMRLGSIGPTRARCFKKLEAALRTVGY